MIFKFIPTVEAYSIINWTSESTDTVLVYITDIISDLLPFILIVLGLAVATWFISRLLNRE
jgi:hypothetical protein